jgi:hypothetical protein
LSLQNTKQKCYSVRPDVLYSTRKPTDYRLEDGISDSERGRKFFFPLHANWFWEPPKLCSGDRGKCCSLGDRAARMRSSHPTPFNIENKKARNITSSPPI